MEEEQKIENLKITEIPQPAMRQIIIETDGNKINVIKAEVAGNLEMVSILNVLLQHFSK